MMRPLMTAFLLCLATTASGLTELTAQFGHQKQIYGANRQNEIIIKNYYGGVSFYLLGASTALDVYYSRQIQVDQSRGLVIEPPGSNIIITDPVARVKNQSYGIGIKQALAPRSSFLRPTISIGHARQVIKSFREFHLKNKSNNRSNNYQTFPTITRYASIFSIFALQIRLSRRMSIQASAQTIFEAFKFHHAKDNIRYLFGLTWFI